MDLAKAFDSVNHNILLKKLEKYGVRGVSLQLIDSYLKNRHQCTIVNHVKSNWQITKCGVPQGSTLGPLLFLIYINDLPTNTKMNVQLFADDAILTLSRRTPIKLQNDVNKELNEIDIWMKLNKLSINYNKTNYMIITKKKINHKFTIGFGQNFIIQKSHVKYLGIILDEKLTFKEHDQHLFKKLCTGSWALTHLKHYVNTETLLKIYYSLIYSHLQYCISCWGGASANTLKPIIQIQKRTTRLVTENAYRAPTNPLFKQLKTLKLKDIYKLSVAKLMNKMHNGELFGCERLDNLTQVHHYGTRLASNLNYFPQSIRTNLGKRLFSYVGPLTWQEVPSGMKSASAQVFKKKFKKYLIDKYHEEET